MNDSEEFMLVTDAYKDLYIIPAAKEFEWEDYICAVYNSRTYPWEDEPEPPFPEWATEVKCSPRLIKFRQWRIGL